MMTRPSLPLRLPAMLPATLAPALFVAALAATASAQQTPGNFTLPEPRSTPTAAPAPVPEGPADELAGVPIPPRSQQTPRIAPEPVLMPEAPPTLSSQPPGQTSPQAGPTPPPSPPPAPPAAATPVPAATATTAAPAAQEAAVTPAPEPGFGALETPAAPVALPETTPGPASLALGEPVLDWRWLAGAAALLALALAGLVAWRRRKPRVLRLAAPPPETQADAPPAPPRIDVALDITGATRSVMMVTLQYRLTLANRTERAVNDLGVAVQLACAQRGQNNAAPLAAARGLARIARIGPHQSQVISGEVQMPFAEVAPIMQGRTPLFIPLVHVTIEGEGQQAIARSFVVGTPGPGSEGRVQPLLLDMPPGSLPDLKARAITAPAG
ncbi:hypothetical protein [Erythrobacter dokdonensis]|uniref:hypothetical protein n=1 Tax=Erythrobacter dokdonensis TaxID=328225 RepID=UPI000A38A4D4|nr:hypothetical protein [Erythrobacter dokdonensis]